MSADERDYAEEAANAELLRDPDPAAEVPAPLAALMRALVEMYGSELVGEAYELADRYTVYPGEAGYSAEHVT